ncbi:MAG: GatB/YqeY domain-containing protein [Gammaproteobacteria bacterium]
MWQGSIPPLSVCRVWNVSSPLKQGLTDDMKAAMRAGDKPRLGVIRLILAAIKQVEVDTRTDLSDSDVLAVLDKMVKQRRDSSEQYAKAGREDLKAQEDFEITVLEAYLPQPLSDEELTAIIDAAIAESGAASMKEMGKVMGLVKPQVQGRADMGKVSGTVKARLSA